MPVKTPAAYCHSCLRQVDATRTWNDTIIDLGNREVRVWYCRRCLDYWEARQPDPQTW